VEKILLTVSFVKGSKREMCHINFQINITVAMGRCRQPAHCYVQSLPSGLDHNSNEPTWCHFACTCANGYVACWRKEYPMENVPLAIFFT
jgi:hypothetical protein